jgi:hypothetical protein
MPIISIKYSTETLTAGTDAGRRHTTLQVSTPRPIYSKSVNRVNKINRGYPEYSRFVIG